MDMSVLDTAIEIKGQLDTLKLALNLLQGGASIMVVFIPMIFYILNKNQKVLHQSIFLE